MLAPYCFVSLMRRLPFERSQGSVNAVSVNALSVLATAAGVLEACQHLIEGEAAGLLPRRELLIGDQVLGYIALGRDQYERTFEFPFAVLDRGVIGQLERVGAEVEELRDAQAHQRVLPDIRAVRPLLQEYDLPAIIVQAGEISVVGPVKIFLALAGAGAGQEIALVVAVEVNLEGLACSLIAGQELPSDVWLASRRYQCRHPVFVRDDVVDLDARLDHARPADHARDAVAALPVGVFLAAERRGTAVGPAEYLG